MLTIDDYNDNDVKAEIFKKFFKPISRYFNSKNSEVCMIVLECMAGFVSILWDIGKVKSYNVERYLEGNYYSLSQLIYNMDDNIHKTKSKRKIERSCLAKVKDSIYDGEIPVIKQKVKGVVITISGWFVINKYAILKEIFSSGIQTHIHV